MVGTEKGAIEMKDNGGYVCPQETGYTHGDGSWIVEGGKTLRDDYAGQAMTAMVNAMRVAVYDAYTNAPRENRDTIEKIFMEVEKSIPIDSYKLADAMIEEKRRTE